MQKEPACPKCGNENTYTDNSLWVCPMCGHEWADSAPAEAVAESAAPASTEVRDANGNILQSGDSVTVIKELKIKGSSSAVKVGTKVRKIRIIDDPEDGHNIACKIDGLGAINLKSEFVKKA